MARRNPSQERHCSTPGRFEEIAPFSGEKPATRLIQVKAFMGV
jgi:hypothetical protein